MKLLLLNKLLCDFILSMNKQVQRNFFKTPYRCLCKTHPSDVAIFILAYFLTQ